MLITYLELAAIAFIFFIGIEIGEKMGKNSVPWGMGVVGVVIISILWPFSIVTVLHAFITNALRARREGL